MKPDEPSAGVCPECVAGRHRACWDSWRGPDWEITECRCDIC